MNRKEENEINIGFLLQSLFHHIWIIVLVTLVFGIGFFVYAKNFITPMYSTTAKMYVNNIADSSTTNSGYITNTGIEAAKKLVDTYVAILETPDTLNQVIEKSQVKYSCNQLLGMISADSVNETEVFYITVSAPSPEEAMLIANTITEVLPNRISEIVEGSSVRVVQNALMPTSIAYPDLTSHTLMGALLGFFISCVIILILELVDNTIHDMNYPTETYEVRTLAAIPDLKEGIDKSPYSDANNKYRIGGRRNSARKYSLKRKQSGYSYGEERSILCDRLPFAAAEAYKMLRTSLLNISDNSNDYSVIGITSPNPSEGKSTLAINLAYTLAQANKSVLLIEADLRKPVLAKRLKLSPRSGLSNMLEGDCEGAVQNSGYFDNWKVICAGKTRSNSSELLDSHAMEVLIADLRTKYDNIIIDFPPINEVTDALAISRCLDGMLLAVRQNSTTKMDLDTTMNHMEFSKTELIGFVVTNANIGGKYGKYGKYGRYGKYGKYGGNDRKQEHYI